MRDEKRGEETRGEINTQMKTRRTKADNERETDTTDQLISVQTDRHRTNL